MVETEAVAGNRGNEDVCWGSGCELEKSFVDPLLEAVIEVV